MRRRVMGLDLSFTRTGVCVWDGSEAQPSSISTGASCSYLRRAQYIRREIWALIESYQPSVICVEAPLSHAHRAEILTGLFFLVMDRLDYYLSKCEISEALVVLPNPSMRKLMGIKQGRGSKAITKTEFKKKIVAQARSLAGPGAPDFNHDEADAFHLAYYAGRFWGNWLGENCSLTDTEKDVWYSEQPVKKITKKKGNKAKRTGLSKKKGLVHRRGEFFFLPRKVD